MKVTYTGPHEGGVTVVDRDTDTEFEVAFGETVELRDALVARLVEQDPDAWRVTGAAVPKLKKVANARKRAARSKTAKPAPAAVVADVEASAKDGE